MPKVLDFDKYALSNTGPVAVGGAISVPVHLVTGSHYTLGDADYFVEVTSEAFAPSGTVELTIPSASNSLRGRVYLILNSKLDSSVAIDGGIDLVLPPGNATRLLCTGERWVVIPG